MASLFKSSTTYDPILLLLNADGDDERDKLTRRWKDSKLQELNFIGIVGALLAGVLTSTGSWPSILPDGSRSPWTVRACWYCGIVLALSSVLVSAQQSIRLHRVSCHRDDMGNLRKLLANSRKHRGRNGQILPRRVQVYAWQMAAMFLTLAVLCMLGGMFILLWSATGPHASFGAKGWWTNEAKLAVTFSIVAAFCGSLFLVMQVTLFTYEGDEPHLNHDEVSPNRDRSTS